jgi:putative exporter of polyketide antibiotics
VAVIAAGGLVAGLCTWLGIETQGSGVAFVTLLNAGVNVVPPAVCLLGIGVMAMGLWPRGTAYVVYGFLGWSLLIELVGGFGSGGRWLLDTSLFHQMAAAPAVDPNWTVNGVMVAIGAVAALVGAVSFSRRDLRSA